MVQEWSDSLCFAWLRFVRFRFISFRFILFRFVLLRFVSFRFNWLRLVLSRLVSAFRFVSFVSSRFVLIRLVQFAWVAFRLETVELDSFFCFMGSFCFVRLVPLHHLVRVLSRRQQKQQQILQQWWRYRFFCIRVKAMQKPCVRHVIYFSQARGSNLTFFWTLRT